MILCLQALGLASSCIYITGRLTVDCEDAIFSGGETTEWGVYKVGYWGDDGRKDGEPCFYHWDEEQTGG